MEPQSWYDRRYQFSTDLHERYSDLQLQDGREGETLSGTNEKSTVEQLRLPHGKCIGKLVVTRDGRVKLNVGGHSMDVAHTASEGQHQVRRRLWIYDVSLRV